MNIFEQTRESFETGSRDMPKLTFVEIMDGMIEGLEKLEALGSDAGDDDTAVVGLALASDEATLFHAVEEAGDIGVVRDHSFADAAARKTVGFSAAEDAEDIVLSAGKAGVFEKLIGLLNESVGGFDDTDERAVGERGSDGRLASLTHEVTIVV